MQRKKLVNLAEYNEFSSYSFSNGNIIRGLYKLDKDNDKTDLVFVDNDNNVLYEEKIGVAITPVPRYSVDGDYISIYEYDRYFRSFNTQLILNSELDVIFDAEKEQETAFQKIDKSRLHFPDLADKVSFKTTVDPNGFMSINAYSGTQLLYSKFQDLNSGKELVIKTDELDEEHHKYPYSKHWSTSEYEVFTLTNIDDLSTGQIFDSKIYIVTKNPLSLKEVIDMKEDGVNVVYDAIQKEVFLNKKGALTTIKGKIIEENFVKSQIEDLNLLRLVGQTIYNGFSFSDEKGSLKLVDVKGKTVFEVPEKVDRYGWEYYLEAQHDGVRDDFNIVLSKEYYSDFDPTQVVDYRIAYFKDDEGQTLPFGEITVMPSDGLYSIKTEHPAFLEVISKMDSQKEVVSEKKKASIEELEAKVAELTAEKERAEREIIDLKEKIRKTENKDSFSI